MRQNWVATLAWLDADATPVASTTDETIVAPDVTIEAGYMENGRCLRVRAFGKLSTTGTPTMTWAIRWGGVGGTLLAQTEAITMGSGVSDVNWALEAYLQARSNGSTGTILTAGRVDVHTAAGTVLSNLFSVSGYDSPAAVTVDLTTAKLLSVTADWSASSASNTLTCLQRYVESLN
jgi:hypothetical protein